MTKQEYDKLIDQNPLGLPRETLEFLKEHPRPDFADVPYEDPEAILVPNTAYRVVSGKSGGRT